MSQEKTYRPRVRRSGVHLEEEKAWISFYRRVGNPDIAMEVMHQRPTGGFPISRRESPSVFTLTGFAPVARYARIRPA